MIYYEKKNIKVTEDDNFLLWQACQDVCYDGRVVMSYSRKDMLINEYSIAIPSLLPIAVEVEPEIVENLVHVSVIPGLDAYSIEIVYQVEKEDEEADAF